MVSKVRLFYPLPLAVFSVKRQDTMIMAICHCIVCTVSFCQGNNHLDPLLIKLAQTMNLMKTASGLQCNWCILLGRLVQYCVWFGDWWGGELLGLQGRRHFFILQFSWTEVFKLAIWTGVGFLIGYLCFYCFSEEIELGKSAFIWRFFLYFCILNE